MNDASSYYYNQLNRTEQEAYYAMKEGITALAPSFPVPLLTGKRLSEISFLLRLDHPELFWLEGFSFRAYSGAEHAEMIPEYLFDRKKVIEQKTAMEARVKKLIQPALKLDEKGKEQYIHDFICRNVTYDKLKKSYSHEIIGALGHGVAVCEGISKSVKRLCDELNVWCVIALSDNNPEKGIRYRHTWNVVRIGGKYYHLDATFDNTLSTSERIRYDYFNLDDRLVFRDHEPVIYRIPACTDEDHFYYKEEKQSFTKSEEVQKRAAQFIRKGKPFLFHWRGGYLTKEVLSDLLERIGSEARKKEKHVRVSLNWPQAVILAEVVEEASETEVTIEHADESEGEENEKTNVCCQHDASSAGTGTSVRAF